MRIACLISMVLMGVASASELEVTVVDLASGSAVKQARVQASVDGSQSSLVTGANGVGVIPLPAAGVQYDVLLTVSAAGYVPTLVHWDVAKLALPEVYILRLEPGTSVSGTVVYEDGKPIEGASVRLFVAGNRDGIVQPAITDLEILTDDKGRWRCDVLPKSLTKLQVRVMPPGKNRVRSVTFIEGGDFDISSLRDGSARIEISRRFSLSGRVLNEAGEPVEGAQLVGWPVSSSASSGSFVRSERDGSFVFENVRAERMMISTVMDGLAPEMTAASPGPDAEPIEINLEAGQTIRGQVTDLNGDPIEGVRVAPHTWRGQRVLSIEMKTDEEGLFEWNGAPEDGVIFEIRKPGYAGHLEEQLFPGESMNFIALQELLRIGGAVVDDETGEPMEGFKVYQGTYWDSAGDVQWSSFASDEGYKGEYELYIEAGTPAVQVRVEADGYLPAMSRVYNAEEGYQRYDVRMKKGSGPSGVVTKPDGTPAAKVSVFMSPVSGRTILKDGKSSDGDTRYVRTDENGAYSFAPLYPEFRLAVIDEVGYKIANYALGESAYNLVLEPSAAIEGTVITNGEPSAYERVRITFDPIYNEQLQLEFGASTNPDGVFTLAGLPPGEAKIELMGNTDNMVSSVDSKLVLLESGERASVTVGGRGRSLAGRVELPSDVPPDFDRTAPSLMISSIQPTPKIPDDVDQNDTDAVNKWYGKWFVSEEGRQYREGQRLLMARVRADGTFRVAYIPPGDYGMDWRLTSPEGERIGKVSHRFTVASGTSDIDLGMISLEQVTYVKVGDEAPLFEVPSLDGVPVKLADFRGKYVLLDFWATWCGPCIVETPNLVALFNRFGDDERFAMIGLSLDNRVDEPLDYTSKNEMNWTQVFLGEWSTTTVPEEYGVEGIPSIMLLGPDGKVVETGLRGAGMVDAVAKYLE